jgi:hypothetical protein
MGGAIIPDQREAFPLSYASTVAVALSRLAGKGSLAAVDRSVNSLILLNPASAQRQVVTNKSD